MLLMEWKTTMEVPVTTLGGNPALRLQGSQNLV